jgi:regulatory protein YycH of two-component signal transduction system YycFG
MLDDETKLPGAETVRSELANNPEINFEDVTNMTIGYRMEEYCTYHCGLNSLLR